MEKKEAPAPYCHGEPMESTYRYKGKDGIEYRTWICYKLGCKNKIQLPLYVEENG